MKQSIEIFEQYPESINWLARSHLLLGSLQPSEDQALSAFMKAESLVKERSEGSGNRAALAIWAESLLRQGRAEETTTAVGLLRELNFTDVGLDELCRRENLSCPIVPQD